jgi:hypothetical protein
MPAQLGSAEAALKLEDFLPYRLNVCANIVSNALSRIYAERYKIGVPEWRVLVTLGQFGMMTAKAIGIHSHMHKLMETVEPADRAAFGRALNKLTERSAQIAADIAKGSNPG